MIRILVRRLLLADEGFIARKLGSRSQECNAQASALMIEIGFRGIT